MGYLKRVNKRMIYESVSRDKRGLQMLVWAAKSLEGLRKKWSLELRATIT
jgi:hypothetical protein